MLLVYINIMINVITIIVVQFAGTIVRSAPIVLSNYQDEEDLSVDSGDREVVFDAAAAGELVLTLTSSKGDYTLGKICSVLQTILLAGDI